ncbi:MAG: hypothetical protein ABSE96_19295 [Terracidiphilus sp.]|jgi:hypothetical protein
MRTSAYGFALVWIACITANLAAWGQVTNPNWPGRFDVAFTYNPMLANLTTGNEFWMQGGSGQVHARIRGGLGVAGNVIGLHIGDMHGSGVGLDLIAYTFGPRYTWAPARSSFSFFGEALVGGVHGANSIFPTGNQFNPSGNSLAVQLGGGVGKPLSHHFLVRIFEADWLRTQLPNATTNVQNNLRLGAGVVWRF